MSHQTMIDSISDKGSALASTKVKGKLNDLNAKYHTLCGSAQVKLLMFALLKEARSDKDCLFLKFKFLFKSNKNHYLQKKYEHLFLVKIMFKFHCIHFFFFLKFKYFEFDTQSLKNSRLLPILASLSIVCLC